MEYHKLVSIYETLDATSKRLDKTFHLARFLLQVHHNELPKVILLLQGRVFPVWDERKIGVAARLVLKALNVATGVSTVKVEQEWKHVGDLGRVAEKLIQTKKQETLFSQQLTVTKVFSNLQKLAELEGQGTVDRKIQLLSELLTSAKPLEARYLVRTVLEDLRVGSGAGVLRDAIVYAFFPTVLPHAKYCSHCDTFISSQEQCLLCGKELSMEFSKQKFRTLEIASPDDLSVHDLKKYDLLITPDETVARAVVSVFMNSVERAYSLTNDFTELVLTLKEKGLKGLLELSVVPLHPVKVMLYPKATSIQDAFAVVGKPAAFEFKYDGFRLIIHKVQKQVKLFTRNLEDVTEQFPDVVSLVNEHIHADAVILDSEAVGYDVKTTQYLPFQRISQRIKRKYRILELAAEFPVEVNVFDVLYYNGKSFIDEPFHARRALLSKMIDPIPRKIVLSRITVTDNEEEAHKFYQASLDAGNEGVMGKSLNAPYKPGARVGYGVKVKPVMESLDVVIIAAEWGTGKRAQSLTSFTIACVNDDGKLLELGKVSTGIKELEGEGVTYTRMTELLTPLIIEEKGREVRVKPEIVIEVHYEEIQKSPSYTSGYALRFPRFVRLREDRSLKDISTLELAQELYLAQRGRNEEVKQENV